MINIHTEHMFSINEEVVLEMIEEKPSECPICRKGISPNFILCYMKDDKLLELLFHCPRLECESLFFSIYEDKGKKINENEYSFIIHEWTMSYPHGKQTIAFNPIISEISKDFIIIYNEAAFAENSGLDTISGVGYRKSLEFLIKDYCINILGNIEQDIKSKPLSQCIQLIEDSRVKEMARRALFIGNDETHYEKKWQHKDIKDLKILIDLTINFIESEIHYTKYLEEMPEQ